MRRSFLATAWTAMLCGQVLQGHAAPLAGSDIPAGNFPGDRGAEQPTPGKPFVPFAGSGPPPWMFGPPVAGPTVAQALHAAQAAIAFCKKSAHADIGIAILDTIGQPRLMMAADGVRGWHVYSAARKALTALAFMSPSSHVANHEAGDTVYRALIEPNMTTMPGAVPLLIRNVVVGAIGASGGKSGEQDEACAQAGADAFQAQGK